MSAPTGRRFTYRGRTWESGPGETLLTALSRAGLPVLSRSNRYRRPRGPFCGVGQCTGCLLRVNERPGIRACRHIPSDGESVESERGWPSPSLDILGAVDLFFPGGMDALHGLRRPAFLTPLYQWGVRRLLGGGRLPSVAAAPAAGAPPAALRTDVVVIGAGRSGQAIASALVRAGSVPTVLDRALRPRSITGADVRIGTSASFLPTPIPGTSPSFTLLGSTETDGGLAVRARAIVVATGSFDGGLLFGGNDRPGVLTAEGALSLAASGSRPPFRRAVVVGGGDRASEVLDRLGDQVSAVVAPGEIRPELVRRASELEIPLYPRSLVLSSSGRHRVRRLELRTRGRGPRFSLPCDAVVLAHRRLPNSPLLFQAGARMEWDEPHGAYFPPIDPLGATSVPGLFAVGSVAGSSRPLDEPTADRIARAILGSVPAGDPTPRSESSGPGDMAGYYRELLGERRTGRWFACPCEDVLLGEVEEAVRNGYRGIEVVKRYTGLGTGLCQGRYCVADALLLLSILESRPPSAVGYITQRPPVFPMPLGALAGLDDAVLAEAGR